MSRTRPTKLPRLMARLSARRGCSHTTSGSGLFLRAISTPQLAGGFRQAFAQRATQGQFVLIEAALAIGAGEVAGAVRRAAAAGFQQGGFAVGMPRTSMPWCSNGNSIDN